MTPDTPIWRLLLPLTAMGAAVAFIFSPLAATATRNLPPQLAGAGSGVYNTTRQVGSVLGSAGMAALMASQLSTKIPGAADASQAEGQVAQLPEFLQPPFASAMSQAMLLPAFIALFGVIAALFLLPFLAAAAPPLDEPAQPREPYDPDHELYWADGEDEYFEYEVSWEHSEPHQPAPAGALADTDVLEPVTEPMREEQPPAVHNGATSDKHEWRSILDQLLDDPVHTSNGDARNGFDVPEGEGQDLPRGRHSRD